MIARTYIAAVRRQGSPNTLDIIGTGSVAECRGAIQAWRTFTATTGDPTDKPIIVVEVAE